MTIEIKAPTFPESVKDGVFSQIHAYPGDLVLQDDLLFDIETDKVILEVVAPADGKVSEYQVNIGDHVLSNQVLAAFEQCEVPGKDRPAQQEILKNEKPIPRIESSIQEQTVQTSNRLPTIVGVLIGIVVGVAITFIVISE